MKTDKAREDNSVMFVIFRDKKTNDIKKYNLIKKEKSELDSAVSKFNSEQSEFNAEVVESRDFECLIEIAEQNKKIKLSNLKDIEDSIERLRYEFYELTKDLK